MTNTDQWADLPRMLGRMDVYLLDQVLRERIKPGCRILDAGCGSGRNLNYFCLSGCAVHGIDMDPAAVNATLQHVRQFQPDTPDDNFRVEALDQLSFPPKSFDVVVAIAILHFANDEAQFAAMLDAIWRVLKPGGILFSRLASRIGPESSYTAIGNGWYRLADGSDRFLVDEPDLYRHGKRLNATLMDPIKTVNVENKRMMTTWCIRKT